LAPEGKSIRLRYFLLKTKNLIKFGFKTTHYLFHWVLVPLNLMKNPSINPIYGDSDAPESKNRQMGGQKLFIFE
jgi:hypothetical protein